MKRRAAETWDWLVESTAVKMALFAVVVTAALIWIGLADLRPNLSHLTLVVLSGDKQGHYFSVVEQLRERALQQRGRLQNRPTRGSSENAQLLSAATRRCEAHVALAQDGLDWAQSSDLVLLGRLRKAESVLFLGRDADRLRHFDQLRGLRLGIGPVGSGTARVAYQVLGMPTLSGLGLKLSNHPFEQQVRLLARGELDLGVFVIDEDAELAERAVRQGLQIASFEHLDAVARKLPFARVGRIGAGQYDPVQLLPPRGKRVLRVETLLLANSCPSRSQLSGLLALVQAQFPGFVRHNQNTPNHTGLRLATAARDFFANEGQGFLGEHFPWLDDIMPPSNWLHVALAVSVLINVMGFWHRFRLWRIDAKRLRLERALGRFFDGRLVFDDLPALPPATEHAEAGTRRQLGELSQRLRRLHDRCRRQSQSILVPMGHELGYRYQERLIGEALAALTGYLHALDAADSAEAPV